MIVDAHQHFWIIEHGIYDWIDASVAGIKRDYQPVHLQPYLAHLGVDKTILVQAAEDLLENTYMMKAVDQVGFIGGVVAWIDLGSSTAASDIERLKAHPVIKGVRPVLQSIESTEWILQEHIVEALRLTAALDLTFDALIQPRHISVIQRLAELIPNLKIVVDHAAKPTISEGRMPSQNWKDGMATLGQQSNVYCKISGLAAEYGNGWTASSLMPVAEHLLDVFHSNRLMWGSDWPVLEINGSYTQWFECLNELIAGVSGNDRDNILGKTAAEFYGVEA